MDYQFTPHVSLTASATGLSPSLTMHGFRKTIVVEISASATVGTEVSTDGVLWFETESDTASVVRTESLPWPYYRWNVSANTGSVTVKVSQHDTGLVTVSPRGVSAATQAEATAVFAAGYDVMLSASFTLSGNLDVPANRTLWGNGFTITANGGALVTILDDYSSVRKTVFAGSSTYAVQWHSVGLEHGSVLDCTFTSAAGVRVLQASGFSHRYCNIRRNVFNDSNFLVERMTDSFVMGNVFANTNDVSRAITCYGLKDSVISNNTIDRGKTGILLLAFSLIGKFAFTGNTISGNTISGIVEESISIDAQAGTEYSNARDTDDVSSLPGSSQVVLTDAAWAADSTYSGVTIDMVFVNGANVGKYYPVTAQSGATFTLDIPAADYDLLTTSDRATIGWVPADNTIEDNTITVTTEAGTPAGILLWGGCHDTVIQNNTVTMALSTQWAIQVANLNGFTGLNSVTGNVKAWPSPGNVANDNDVVVGEVVQWRRKYGTPTEMDLVDNLVDGEPMTLEVVTS